MSRAEALSDFRSTEALCFGRATVGSTRDNPAQAMFRYSIAGSRPDGKPSTALRIPIATS